MPEPQTTEASVGSMFAIGVSERLKAVESPDGANRSVTRALLALETVANSEAPLSLSALASGLRVPKSTLHSLLKALVTRRYLKIDEGGNYILSVGAVEVGSAYLSRVTPLKVAHHELVSLSRQLAMTAHFAVLDGPDVLYLGKEDAPGVGLRLASAVGTRLPALRTAVGKANLAYIDSSEARLSPAELARIRTDGYAVDEGEIISGVRCVAAPVFDASNICCGAIGVSYLRDGGPPAAKVAVAVIEAADRSSRQLGGRTPRTCG